MIHFLKFKTKITHTHALIIFMKMILITSCAPYNFDEDEYYSSPCEGRPELFYSDPYFLYENADTHNYKTNCNIPCYLPNAFDTLKFDNYYVEVEFEKNYYATSPDYPDMATSVHSCYVGCIGQLVENINVFQFINFTSNYPVDSTFNVGDNINKIISIEEIDNYPESTITYSVEWFLNQGFLSVDSRKYAFKLLVEPVLTDTFSMNIQIRLEAGQEFNLSTEPVIFTKCPSNV